MEVTQPYGEIGDIPPPAGFARVDLSATSYGHYLRSLPLKSEQSIKLHTGDTLSEQDYNTLAVLAAPLLFEEDLEQCADFAMRLWADFLKSRNQLNQLALFDFNGRKRPFSGSGKTYKEYLKWHMAFSNSYSLKLGAEQAGSLENASAGDMIVQNDSDGGIGHVSLVLDQAVNSFGVSVYLVGYSFMPAQEFHVEAAQAGMGFEGWFTAAGMREYFGTVFGSFGQPSLKRFARVNE